LPPFYSVKSLLDGVFVGFLADVRHVC